MMFTFLHAADIHLDSKRAGLSHGAGGGESVGYGFSADAADEGLGGEALFAAAPRRALQKLVDEAIRRQVDFVVIAGDLYDGDWEDFRTGLFLTQQMQRLRERSTPVFLISGNHDAANRMTKSLRLPDNVHWFPADQAGTSCLDELKVAVHGRSFLDRAEQRNLAETYPPPREGWFNLGVLHTSAHLGGGEHDPYAPCSLETLIGKGYDYWALGHIHQRQVLHPTRPVIAYSGNLQGRHVRETGPKGCWLVEVDQNRQAHLEFLPLDVVRWERRRIEAAGCVAPEEVLRRVETALQDAVEEAQGRPLAVRLELQGVCEAHNALLAEPARWSAELLNTAAQVSSRLWIEQIKWETQAATREVPLEEGADELAEFLAAAADDPHVLQAVRDALQPLREKLPDAVFADRDQANWDDPLVIRELIREAQAVLRFRLDPAQPSRTDGR